MSENQPSRSDIAVLPYFHILQKVLVTASESLDSSLSLQTSIHMIINPSHLNLIPTNHTNSRSLFIGVLIRYQPS